MYMWFDGHELKEHFLITDIRGRGILQNEIELIEVAGKAGAFFKQRKVPIRILEVDVVISADSPSHIRERIRDINNILSVEEPKAIVFSDDDEITYHGIPAESEEDGEVVATNRSTIIFVCADPYSYSPEKEHPFKFDVTTVENNGSEESEPIFELDVLQPVTFALVQNQDDEYMMIGRPSDDDIQEIDTKSSVLYENGSTIDEWQTATLDMVDDHFIKNIDGKMGTDGAGIRADGYGKGDKLHGPAVFKELDSPIQDFEIETTFDIISRREIENFRMGILFLDENASILGHIGIKDNSRTYKRRVPLARYGPYRGGGRSNGNLIGDSKKNDNARETTLFYLRVKRIGNMYDFYIGEWQSHKHIRSWHETYYDESNEYSNKLKYITLYISSYADRVKPSRLRMNSVEVFELLTVTEDQTPYIARRGDKIILDHVSRELLLNGENIKTEKDFGATYFTLKKGENELIVHPSDSFATVVKYKETSR